ncbi:MAG: protein translocase subunit SecDF [Marinifilaceae bacterium]|nr:protein translocase subunit SecDF [Marinifilaceae bacterium]
MQNKGAITLLAVLIGLVSLYHLSFTWKANNVEKAAKVYANGDSIQERAYLDSVSYFGFNYNEIKELELNLGLDLRGGMNVTMEVDIPEVILNLSNYSQDENFKKAMELAKSRMVTGNEDFITLFGEAYEEIAPGNLLSSTRIFTQNESLSQKIVPGASNQEVLGLIRDEAQETIDNIYQVMSKRIDQFGVVQPNIRKAEEKAGRIFIELPGVTDANRIKGLLERTAILEFYETYDNNPQTAKVGDVKFYELMSQANARIAEINKASLAPEDSLTQVVSLYSYLQPSPYNGSIIGFAHVNDTARINSMLSMLQTNSGNTFFPRDARFVWDSKSSENNTVGLHAIKVNEKGRAKLDGGVVTSARVSFEDQNGGRPSVSMSMNSEGASIWANLTRENIGRCIAIVLDGTVISSPTVQNEIKGGSSQITGNFTVAEAEDLANILTSGKVAAPPRVIASQEVGPSLGQESIESGMWSFVIAFVLILVYMFFFYSKGAGLAADIALLINLFFLFGVLSSFGAVLTLPGIAGIVLTMGMAVDANVLIYERIQEELLGGKSPKDAVKAGYHAAYSAIIDSQVTTLLTGFILYFNGEGPIKGFATTLIIGIFTSLFTAIFISRIIIDTRLNKGGVVTFCSKYTMNWLRNVAFPFMNRRKVGYTVSGIISVICLIALFTIGLNKGIDFVGGRSYTVQFPQSVEVEQISTSLGQANIYGSNPEVKTFGSDNQVKITTKYKVDQNGAEVDAEIDSLLYVGVKPYLAEGTTLTQFKSENILETNRVGAAIANNVADSAVTAVLLSLIAIFLYILIRFNKWQFGAGALVGLAHNTIVLLGVFALFGNIMPFSMEIDQSFIAAILTVVGYSINDTVVVFDRIREYMKLYPKRDFTETTNAALNSTLRRTFSTSLSTLVVLIAIFIFGGASIRGFVFALLLGVCVGTYSTLFVATPIAYDLLKKKLAKK